MKKLIFSFFILLSACTISQNHSSTDPLFLLSIGQPQDYQTVHSSFRISGTLYSTSDITSIVVRLSNAIASPILSLFPVSLGSSAFSFQTNYICSNEGVYYLQVSASNQSGQTAFSSLITFTNTPALYVYQTNLVLTTNMQVSILCVETKIITNAFYLVSNVFTPFQVVTHSLIYSNTVLVASNSFESFLTNTNSSQIFLSNVTLSTNTTHSDTLLLLSIQTQVIVSDLGNAVQTISNFTKNWQKIFITNTFVETTLIYSVTNISNWQDFFAATNLTEKIMTNTTLVITTNELTNINTFYVTNGLDVCSVLASNLILNQTTLSNTFTNGVLLSSVCFSNESYTNSNAQTNFFGKVLPQWNQNGNTYTLSGNGYYFTVDASVSGRISEFSLSNTQIIVQGTGEHQGSTFWSSPQSVWNWPPPFNMDGGSYTVSLISNNTVLILQSYAVNETGLILIKRFQAAPETNRMILIYSLSNFTSSNIQAAPWEVTRVDKAAMLYFPKESSFVGSSDLSPSTETSSECWYNNITVSWKKSFRDGAENWIASLYSGFLFVKKYQSNISQSSFASGESEIEVYAGDNYFEVEEQGTLTTLASHSRLDWTVVWTALAIPASINTVEGSVDLLNWTRTQVSNL